MRLSKCPAVCSGAVVTRLRCQLRIPSGHSPLLWSTMSCYKSSSSVLNRSELNWNRVLPEGDWLLDLPHQENLSRPPTSSLMYPETSWYPSLCMSSSPEFQVFVTVLCSTSLWPLAQTYSSVVLIKVPLCHHDSSCMANTFSFPSLPLLYSPALHFCFWYYLQDWPTARSQGVCMFCC